MEIYEADIYPMKTKKKPIVVNILLAVLFLGVALSLVTRAAGWMGQQNEAKLLVLVNPSNRITEDVNPEFTIIEGTQMVDSRCANDLEELLRDCRREGHKPYLCGSYRAWSDQQELYEETVGQLMEDGLDREAAENEAAGRALLPGVSEHQLGLSVDIVDEKYTALDEKQAETATQKWLMNNSWRYGFILRYPEGKSDVTGIVYEPWHYRYVGRTAAQQIFELNLTLEEYVDMFYA